MCFFEFWIRHVGVDLSCGDRRMPEKFLDNTYVSTIGKEGGGKAMTKGMCMHVLKNSRPQSIFLYHIRDKKTSESYIFIIQIGRMDIFYREIMSDKEGREVVVTGFEVGSNRIPRIFSEVDNAQFISLSTYGEFHRFQIHIATIESGEFRNTEPGRIDTFTDGKISFSDQSFSLNTFEESFDFLLSQKSNFTIWSLHEINGGWIEAGYLFLLEVFEPTSNSDHMGIYGFDRESSICERQSPGIKIFFHYGFNYWFSNRSRKLEKWRLPVFDSIAGGWWQNIFRADFYEFWMHFSDQEDHKTPEMKNILFLCFS